MPLLNGQHCLTGYKVRTVSGFASKNSYHSFLTWRNSAQNLQDNTLALALVTVPAAVPPNVTVSLVLATQLSQMTLHLRICCTSVAHLLHLTDPDRPLCWLRTTFQFGVGILQQRCRKSKTAGGTLTWQRLRRCRRPKWWCQVIPMANNSTYPARQENCGGGDGGEGETFRPFSKCFSGAFGSHLTDVFVAGSCLCGWGPSWQNPNQTANVVETKTPACC